MNNESLLTRILRSVFFKKATGKAGRYAGNTASLIELVKQAVAKLQANGFREGVSGAAGQVQLLIRMVRAYASGEYKSLPWKSLVSIVAVLIYFVSPIDLIPDFLPIIGLTDDIALVVWLMKTLSEDIGRFAEWEKSEKTVNIG